MSPTGESDLNPEVETESTLVDLVVRAESELSSDVVSASRTDLEGAAHLVAPDDWELYSAILDGLEARQRAPQKPYRLTDPATIQPAAIEWFWEERIATGTLSLLVGPGGVGKGALWVELGARATRGALAGDLRGHPVAVLVLTAEDRLSDVIVPRLRAADADLTRVRVLTMPEADYDRDLTLPEDLPELREAIAETDARLVVIDPLNSHLADRIDSHKDLSVRRALGPLTRLAADTKAAVVGVAHTNKGSGDAVNRVLGSVGYVNAARSVLIVGRPPDGDDGPDRIVAVTKTNNTRSVPSLRFRLEARHIQGRLPDGRDGEFEVVSITWLGEDSASADELLASKEDRTALADAIDFLGDLLTSGPLPKTEVSRAARAEDVAERTLHRARHAPGVVVERDESSTGRPSTWRLPADPDDDKSSDDDKLSDDDKPPEPPEGYVPTGLARNPLARNQQRPDQGKRTESDHYVPRVDDGTKPPKSASVQAALDAAETAVRDAFPGSTIVDEDEDLTQ